MYRIMVHLDDEKRVEGALRNIKNLFKDMEEQKEEVEVELVANSSGIKPFKKENVDNLKELDELLNKGLKIVLCNNALISLKLRKEDFLKEANTVRSSIGEFTRKQNDGWAYIKP